MLPSLAMLSLPTDTDSASEASSTSTEWRMPYFAVGNAERVLPAKTHPKGKHTLRYRIAKCPYCSAEIDVCASKFDSLLAGRVRAHLEVCPDFHWDLAPLRRSRVRDAHRKPCGAETPMNQLVLGANGGLVRHELGSLIKCVAKGRRAAEQRPVGL